MAEYRLTDRARADLIDIYDFTESKFGAYQADAYHAGLIRSFGLLADFDASAFNHISSSTPRNLITLKSAPSFMARKTSDHNFSSKR